MNRHKIDTTNFDKLDRRAQICAGLIQLLLKAHRKANKLPFQLNNKELCVDLECSPEELQEAQEIVEKMLGFTRFRVENN
jgi:hypothetical protein